MKIPELGGRSIGPGRARHLLRSCLIAALAVVVLTLAMAPRGQGLRGAAQSQSMLRVHHHHAKRHDRNAALTAARQLSIHPRRAAARISPADAARSDRYCRGPSTPRAPPVRA
ncbi:MAG TPA: hypothetical protein VNF29_05470 [Candidatus Binataceae bacterium]|nr:hypothetical protein [Candidatus Binataceae bacterium]